MPSTILLSDNGASSGSAGLKQTAGNDGVLILQTTTSGGTATNAVYVDNLQNLGLSVTPSVWQSGYKSIELGRVGNSINAPVASSQMYITANAFWKTGVGDAYANNGTAGYASLGPTGFAYSAAPSGTAGNAITWTTILNVVKDYTLALQGGSTSAAGTGITFPATLNASSDVNTLDDYEEGNWFPTIEGTTTAGTTSYATRAARYTKIGRLVNISCYVNWNSGTGTGNLRLASLPFPHGGGTVYGAVTLSELDGVAMSAGYYSTAYISDGSSNINFEQAPVGGGTTIPIPFDGAGQVILTATYQTSS